MVEIVNGSLSVGVGIYYVVVNIVFKLMYSIDCGVVIGFDVLIDFGD